ncbi:amino acid ABC transporter permease [Rhizobium hidalgonense]|uniref:Amino acid ABC transporter n=1 Tax=Rhizobium hidalgonense TaxID=1538159 RepID=A0A2A6K905_9HYPH|nr:amino acid ABC transporter permease [Rhizobium hidalgonense]MDR9776950.1 amino acid ABC transporter permease [Rhizobium hidalgonense]MDR9813998.1 amino acid ABC transporter permease [Rhizobium hidalgonense]MDR9820684.1 amino acid ABC transporter permease [Rhizobium hidalgonense]PDT21376.1 amino acid ABC transporter [Rhizobium hidalgonense]PON08035.1 amino acid ABC transporter [Rhizobium hidalgonense]
MTGFMNDAPLYLAGLLTTITVSVSGMAIAILLGIMLASALRRRFWPLSLAVRAYVEFARGAPLALVLFLLYYGGPQFGLLLRPYVAGIVGLGVYGAGPFAEIFRAGLNAVPKGEREAAEMLSLTPGQCFLYVELPQALRLTLPPCVGQAIALLKESAVLSVITLGELTKVAGAISSITFAVVTPYVTIALLYWAFVEILSRLGRVLERRFAMKGS